MRAEGFGVNRSSPLDYIGELIASNVDIPEREAFLRTIGDPECRGNNFAGDEAGRAER